VTEGPEIDIDSDRVVLITHVTHNRPRPEPVAATKQNSLKKGKQLKSKTSPNKKKPIDHLKMHELSANLPENNEEAEEPLDKTKFSHLLKLTCNQVFKPGEDEEPAEFKTVESHVLKKS